MLPWICVRQTLTIVVSSPCMTQAQMIVAVVIPRWGTGAALSPLTARGSARRAAQLHAYSSARSLSHFIHTAAAACRETACPSSLNRRPGGLQPTDLIRGEGWNPLFSHLGR